MERYRPPRRPGISASTLKGAHGPGSSLPAPHKRIHRAFPRMAHPGIDPGLPDEADSQLAFASPPWPDLPRHRRDRLSHPHPPDPAPTTRTVPDPAPVRAGGQYGAEGYQADSPVPKIPAQAGIHLLLLPHAQEETSGDGPLPPQGLRGSVFLSHKHRFPGACRGLLQKLRAASRTRLRHAPERRGEEMLSSRKIRQGLSGTQCPDRALALLGPGYLLAQIPG